MLAVRSSASGLQAAQALLELFRAAQELPSAEFLVAHERSSSSSGGGGNTELADQDAMLQQAVAQMRRLFGIQAKYLRSDKAAASYTGELYGQASCLGLKNQFQLSY